MIFAHFGHWTTSLAFFAPVVVLPLGLFLVARFSGDRPEPEDGVSPGPPPAGRPSSPA